MSTDTTSTVCNHPPRVNAARHFLLLAYAFGVIYAANNVPTPLYTTYQQMWHFSAGVITVVFAVYIVGVFASLLTTARLSDQIGRKPIMCAAILVMMVAEVVFLLASSVPTLIIARVLQGLSVGAFSATATAALAETEPDGDSRRAGLYTTSATAVGISVGTLGSGILAQYVPKPVIVVPVVMLVFLLPAFAGVRSVAESVPETVSVRSCDLRRALPALRVPPGIRFAFAFIVIAGFCAFAIVGLFSALAPSLVIQLIHVHNQAVGGLVVAVVFLASALTQLLTRTVAVRTVLLTGLVAIPVGLLVMEFAFPTTSVLLLFTGAVLAGVGNALALSGGLKAVNLLAPPDIRGEVSAAFWAVSYLGTALPVVGVGFLSDSVGLLAATVTFAVVIGAVAAAGIVVGLLHRTTATISQATRRPCVTSSRC